MAGFCERALTPVGAMQKTEGVELNSFDSALMSGIDSVNRAVSARRRSAALKKIDFEHWLLSKSTDLVYDQLEQRDEGVSHLDFAARVSNDLPALASAVQAPSAYAGLKMYYLNTASVLSPGTVLDPGKRYSKRLEGCQGPEGVVIGSHYCLSTGECRAQILCKATCGNANVPPAFSQRDENTFL